MKVVDIKKWIEEYTGLDIYVKTNKRDYFNTKCYFIELVMRYCSEYVTYTKLAELTNYCNHSSISHVRNKFSGLMEVDSFFRREYEKLHESFLEYYNLNYTPVDTTLYDLKTTELILAVKNKTIELNKAKLQTHYLRNANKKLKNQLQIN